MKTKPNEHLIYFLMFSQSLFDLLSILRGICETLNLNHLNPKAKHFAYFQFTFFGLMVKARGILERMIFKAEFLQKDSSQMKIIYYSLLELKKRLDLAYTQISEKKMNNGKKLIIETAEEYEKVFEKISKWH